MREQKVLFQFSGSHMIPILDSICLTLKEDPAVDSNLVNPDTVRRGGTYQKERELANSRDAYAVLIISKKKSVRVICYGYFKRLRSFFDAFT